MKQYTIISILACLLTAGVLGQTAKEDFQGGVEQVQTAFDRAETEKAAEVQSLKQQLQEKEKLIKEMQEVLAKLTPATNVKTIAPNSEISDIVAAAKPGDMLQLQRGSVYTLKQGVVMREGVKLVSIGAGERPIVSYNGPRNGANLFLLSGNDIVQGINFTSIYTTDAEQIGMPHLFVPMGENNEIRENEIGHVGYANNLNRNPKNTKIIDNTVPNRKALRGYFIWNGHAEGTQCIGNTVSNSTREHIARGGGKDFVARGNTFENWADPNDPADQSKGVFVLQNMQGGMIDGNTIIGGGLGTGPLGGPDGTRTEGAAMAVTSDIVISNNSFYGMLEVSPGSERISIRKNKFIGQTPKLVFNGTDRAAGQFPVLANRTLKDIKVEDNEFSVFGKEPAVLLYRVAGINNQLKFNGNIFVLQPGERPRNIIEAIDTPLDIFTSFNENIFPDGLHIAEMGAGNRVIRRLTSAQAQATLN